MSHLSEKCTFDRVNHLTSCCPLRLCSTSWCENIWMCDCMVSALTISTVSASYQTVEMSLKTQLLALLILFLSLFVVSMLC